MYQLLGPHELISQDWTEWIGRCEGVGDAWSRGFRLDRTGCGCCRKDGLKGKGEKTVK